MVAVLAFASLVSLFPSINPAIQAQQPDGLAVVAAIENTIVEAISQAEHSVVSIARVKPSLLPRQVNINNALNARIGADNQSAERADDPTHPEFIPTDFGSGVILAVDPPNANSPRAYILTNYHVVKGGRRVIQDESQTDEFELFVKLSDHKVAHARIFAADPRSDLAVIAISENDPVPIKFSDLKPIKLGDGTKLKKGQLVIALGNPYAAARDGSVSASWGMISNLTRRPGIPPRNIADKNLENLREMGDLIQVDTRLNIGTSGGALINFKGEMVGLTTSLAALAGFEKSSGFAIPVDAAMLRIIQSLKEGKEVEYGMLGVSFQLTHDLYLPQKRFPGVVNIPNGILDFQVLAGGPAATGGLQNDEIILAVNGERVYTQLDLTREINKLGPEARVRLTVWGRNETGLIGDSGYGTRIREVVLAKWGAHDEESIIISNFRYPPWRGMVVDYTTARNKYNAIIKNFSSGAFPRGVLVVKLLPPLNMKQIDIVEGNRILAVNDIPVSTPHEFLKVVRDLKGSVKLLLDNNKSVVIPESANGGPFKGESTK